jgi:hypothetical protein
VSNQHKLVSDETREKLRNSPKHIGPNYKLRGGNNANFKPGVREKQEKAYIDKYGAPSLGKVKWKCEHCEAVGSGLGNLHRWHGERCKSLKTNK